MDGNTSRVDGDDVDWDTEDELEMKTSLYLLQLIQALGRLDHHQDLPKPRFLIILSAWDFLIIWLPKPSKNMDLKMQIQFLKPSSYIT
ncbi:hypothetical protein ABKV19_026570 [Rosa sericea]